MRTLLLLLVLVPSTALAQSSPLLDAVEGDRIRIRRHLETVEADLRAADVSHLGPEARAARARNLDRLHDYRLAGEFPHGRAEQPGMRVPTFIDAEGRACAMGFLVIESGHRDVALAIARAQNHAYVPEIVHPALGPWLLANGMTLTEAARVQPSYCFECDDAGLSPVCTASGNVYPSACLAECELETVTGPADCSSGTCTCGDAGTPATDAGTPTLDAGDEPDAGARIDAGPPVIREDGGDGRVVVRSGCSAAHGRGHAVWLVGLALALALRRRF